MPDSGEKTVTEYRYRLLEADGRLVSGAYPSSTPFELSDYDRTWPMHGPHRQQRQEVTYGPWEDVSDV